MGNSATTLSMMVNRKVDITTPNVKVIKRSEALDDYEKTCIFVQIHYVKGLEGNNVLVLKEHDVKVMTDLMMGGDGTNTSGEITDLHLSAASEVPADCENRRSPHEAGGSHLRFALRSRAAAAVRPFRQYAG